MGRNMKKQKLSILHIFLIFAVFATKISAKMHEMTPTSVLNETPLEMVILNQVHSIETEARSGDVVGNGRIWDNPSLDHLFLSPEEREDRNDRFDIFLDLMGIDPSEARSGDVVGNGGGVYETQAYFYYHNLAKHIVSTFDQDFVKFTDDEIVVLRRILDHMPLFGEQGKLVFLSQASQPGFFFEQNVDEAPRLAKTGFSFSYPIFINREMVYENFDKTSSQWINVLIHELGHQVGVKNHLLLEELGAKVATVAQTDKEQLRYHFDKDHSLEIVVFNHSFVNGVADVNVTFADQSVSLRGLNSQEIKGICGNLSFGGIQFENLHWEKRPGFLQAGEPLTVKAAAWAKVKCQDEAAGLFYDRSRDVTFDIVLETSSVEANIKIK